MKNKYSFGSAIKKLREEKNLSQVQFGELIGKSTGTIGQYERGEIFPTYETLYEIIDFFNVDANIFFARENASKYSLETILMLNLFSQRNHNDQKVIRNFQNDLTRLLNFMENNMEDKHDGEEIT